MTRKLPVLPIKNSVLFPSIHMPFSIGRDVSLAAVEAAVATEDKEIVVVSQRSSSVEKPELEDLYRVGTKAVIKKVARPEDGSFRVIVLGTERVRIDALSGTSPY